MFYLYIAAIEDQNLTILDLRVKLCMQPQLGGSEVTG